MNASVIARKAGRSLTESVSDNPVVVKEFRTRMRGWKAFATMGAYALILIVAMLITLWNMWNLFSGPVQAMSLVNRNIGRYLFSSLTVTQVVLLTLIIPSLTSGSISHELEKQTIEMLALTRLTAGKVVLGKQLSGFLYAVILLVCSIPLAGMCLMFGGISPLEMAVTYAILTAWAFMFASIGVFWSSLCKRTAVATLLSYGGCVLYMLLTSILFGIAASGMGGGPYSPNAFVFSAMNPGFAPYVVLMNAKVCGITLSVALVAVVLEIAIGWLLLLVASTHVRHHRVERGLSIRVLLLVISAATAWLLMGNLVAVAVNTVTEAKYALGLVATSMLILLCLGAAAFATGEVKKGPGDSAISYALSPGKAFRTDLGGAICFMSLWMVILYGTGALTLFCAIQHTHVLPPHFWSNAAKIGVSILSITACVSAVGVLASSIVGNRKNAAGLVVLFTAIAFAAYPIIMTNYQDGLSNPHSLLWKTSAFWPMTPILVLTGQWISSYPKECGFGTGSWIVTSAAYVVMGALALALASLALAHGRGVKEE